MRRVILGTLTALAGAAIFTAGTASGQGGVTSPGVITKDGGVPALGSYKVPKTPWGEPDLQGVYNGNDLQGIPMQRAESVGTRYMLNDAEFKQRVDQRERRRDGQARVGQLRPARLVVGRDRRRVLGERLLDPRVRLHVRVGHVVQNNFTGVKSLPFFTRFGGLSCKADERAQAEKEG